MPDVRVTRGLCEDMRAALALADRAGGYAAPFSVERVRALVALVEACLDAEEAGTLGGALFALEDKRSRLREADTEVDFFLLGCETAILRIRALLGKEERPGE